MKFHKTVLNASRLPIKDNYRFLSVNVIYDAFYHKDVKWLTEDSLRLNLFCSLAGVSQEEIKDRAEKVFLLRN